MKKLLFFFCIFFACDSSTEDCCVNFDTAVFIAVNDRANSDLLNPKTNNAIDFDKIKTFYVVNGTEKEIFHPNRDAPKAISLIELNDKYYLNLNLNIESKNKITTTIIEWPDQSRDHIKAQIERNGGSTFCSKLWHNDILVWEENRKHRFFEILK